MPQKLTQEECDLIRSFWELLKKDIPEIRTRRAERRGTQWSVALNKQQDKIGFFFGANIVQLYIRSGIEDISKPPERTSQMKKYSQHIRKQLGNQQSLDDKGQEKHGASIRVQRKWTRDNKEQWPDAAQWVKEMFVALQEIIVSMK